jgi:hypothetical protein
MFQHRSLQQLFSEFSSRKSPVKNSDKIGLNDPLYIDYIMNYEGLEIIPDIRLLGYEEVLRENKYLVANYPQLADQVWIIGTSGQGDGWFVERNRKNVLFYDHNLGEYESVLPFRDFGISFSEFIQAAFILRELETKLYDEEVEPGIVEHVFKKSMSGVSGTFMELYPYCYF